MLNIFEALLFSAIFSTKSIRKVKVSGYLSVPCKPEPSLLSPLPKELEVYR